MKFFTSKRAKEIASITNLNTKKSVNLLKFDIYAIYIQKEPDSVMFVIN